MYLVHSCAFTVYTTNMLYMLYTNILSIDYDVSIAFRDAGWLMRLARLLCYVMCIFRSFSVHDE